MFTPKYDSSKKHWLNALFLLIITSYVTLFTNFIYSYEAFNFTTLLLFVIYSFVCLKGKTGNKIFWTICSFEIILPINIAITFLLRSVTGEQNDFIFSENGIARLVALFCSKIILYLVLRIILFIFRKKETSLKKSEVLILVVISFVACFIGIALIDVQINRISPTNAYLFITLCIILLYVFVFYMLKRISKETDKDLKMALLNIQLEQQKTLLENTGSISQEIKKAEHDIKHHLLTLLGSMDNKNYDKAEEYLRNLLKEYETHIFKYIIIENGIIGGLLNFKINHCHKNGITTKCSVENDFSDFDEIDICVLLSNLLDNAIEASMNVKNPNIIISLYYEKNYLCVLVKNRIENSVLKDNPKLKTTKKGTGTHGIGLYSVDEIVEKYDGMKTFYEQNGYFIADIWLKKSRCSLSDKLKNEEDYQTRQN
jgi:sensor histidine kinase YesM